MTNPLGYTLGVPQVSWCVEESKGQRTVAARVLVARDEAMTDLVWDSTERENLSSLGIETLDPADFTALGAMR